MARTTTKPQPRNAEYEAEYRRWRAQDRKNPPIASRFGLTPGEARAVRDTVKGEAPASKPVKRSRPRAAAHARTRGASQRIAFAPDDADLVREGIGALVRERQRQVATAQLQLDVAQELAKRAGL